MPKPVLETGAGGITICEVHIWCGPGYGLIVEPCTEDEIRRHVADFSNFLMNPPQAADSGDDSEGDAGSPGSSREVERALRNMTGLRRKRAEKKTDGGVVAANDDARNLAGSVADTKALSVEILAHMELHKRDRRDIWFSDSTGKTPFEWLQETFERVNNGRHPDFTMPRRIELVVPTADLSRASRKYSDGQPLIYAKADTAREVCGSEAVDRNFPFREPHYTVLATISNRALWMLDDHAVFFCSWRSS